MLTGASLAGTTLQLTDAGGTQSVDLSSLQDGSGTDDQNISGSGLTGSTLTIGIEGGTSETVDLSSLINDADFDPDNELITSMALTGTILEITEGGALNTLDLSSLQDGTGTDDQDLTGMSLVGTTLQIDIENGASASLDLSMLLADLQSQVDALLERIDTLESAVNECCGTSFINEFDFGTSAYLGQNFPNPFNGTTTIEYYLPSSVTTAHMNILDAQGAMVERIEIEARGDGHIIFSNNRLAAGSYYYSLYVDGRMVDTKQMVITD